MAVRCVIVDDHEKFLETARRALASTELDIVAVATSGNEAVQLVKELVPDLVLVDVDLGGESGLDVARALSALRRPPRIVFISTHAEDDLADLVRDSPAVGFVSKSRLSPGSVLDLAG